MMTARIGVLLIGQSPREDLTSPLSTLTTDHELVIRGALDALDSNDLPPIQDGDEAYPLSTTLRDKTPVSVDESFLMPRLQALLNDFSEQEVLASVLLCAGEFAELVSERPLLRPFYLTVDILRVSGFSHIAVLVPSDDQVKPSEKKWQREHFHPLVISLEKKPAHLNVEVWLASTLAEHQQLAALVIDYVGYPEAFFEAIRQHLSLPIFDMGRLTIAILESMLLRTVIEEKHIDLEGDRM